MSISLNEFGRRVGCDYTTASRLLSGDRAPSTRLLGRICNEFGLDGGEALKILEQDRKDDPNAKTLGFADWLRGNAFEGGHPDLEEPLDTTSTNE